MPLFVVSSPSGRQVIVNAGSAAEAVQTGNSFVGGPAQARPATYADAQTIPLLGPMTRGDNRPAAQADPDFLRSQGLVAPGSSQEIAGQLGFGGQVGGGAGFVPATSTGGFNQSLSGETAQTRFQPEEGLGRAGAFRRALAGRGVDTGTLVGGSLLGQQGQFEDIFDVLQALGRAPGGERAFETFAGGQSNPFMAARDLFQEVGGIPAGQANDRVRAIQNPTTAEELGGTARFGQAALRGQVGAFGSNPFLRNLIGRLPDEYAALPQSQQAATPFFNYLRQRIGI